MAKEPMFNYTPPNTAQPAPQQSQLMDYYMNYGYGPEQQFFTWKDRNYGAGGPAAYGPGGQGNPWTGVAGMGQAAPAPDTDPAMGQLLNWWNSSIYNPQTPQGWGYAQHQFMENNHH